MNRITAIIGISVVATMASAADIPATSQPSTQPKVVTTRPAVFLSPLEIFQALPANARPTRDAKGWDAFTAHNAKEWFDKNLPGRQIETRMDATIGKPAFRNAEWHVGVRFSIPEMRGDFVLPITVKYAVAGTNKHEVPKNTAGDPTVKTFSPEINDLMNSDVVITSDEASAYAKLAKPLTKSIRVRATIAAVSFGGSLIRTHTTKLVPAGQDAVGILVFPKAKEIEVTSKEPALSATIIVSDIVPMTGIPELPTTLPSATRTAGNKLNSIK